MFRSVFVDAKIANPATGKTASLSIINDGQAIPFLEDVSINLEAGANLNLGITFAPPYKQALELISKDNEWLRLGNTLGVRWGYADVPGAISDWYYGFIGEPQVSFGDEISVTVTATTLAQNADRLERMRDWCSVLPRSYKYIAEKIAQRYGLKVVFEGTLSRRTQKMINEPRQSFVQGGRTDLQFLLEEGEKFGIRMIALNDKLYFVDSAAPLPGYPQVNAKFQMYGRIDVRNNIFPMNSFSSESMGVLFLRQQQGTSSLGYGPNDDPTVEKEPIVATDKTTEEKAFTAPSTLSNPSETDGRPPKGMEDIQTKATIKAVPSDDEGGRMFCLPFDGSESKDFIESRLQAARDGSAEEHGLSVNFGSGIALPNLFPRMFVGLGGVGDYFSGNYMLQTVGIRIDTGGAEMDCGAFGRGFPAVDRKLDPFASEMIFEEKTDVSLDDLLFAETKEAQ